MSNFVVAHRLSVLIAYNILVVVWGNLVLSKYFGCDDICLIKYKEEYDDWWLALLCAVRNCLRFLCGLPIRLLIPIGINNLNYILCTMNTSS